MLRVFLSVQTPESPVWLLSKNRSTEAKKSLAYLRGCVSTDDVEEEFSELSFYAGFDKSVDIEQYANCDLDQRRLSYVKYLQINTNDTTNGQASLQIKYNNKRETKKNNFKYLQFIFHFNSI